MTDLTPESNVIELHLSTGRSGTTYGGAHNGLSGRDEANSHPMGAITGLNNAIGAINSRIDYKADTSALAGAVSRIETVELGLTAETTARQSADNLINGDVRALGLRVSTLEASGGIVPAALNAKQNKIGIFEQPATDTDGDIWIESGGFISVDPTAEYVTANDLEAVGLRIDTEITSRANADASILASVDTAVNSALTAAKAYADGIGARGLAYKGSVTNAQLSAITTPNLGDMYNITDAGTFPIGVNVAWDGSQWDSLAPTIDLSVYDSHIEARNNPHGVTWEQIGLSQAQTTALNSGITGQAVQTITTDHAKLTTIEEGAEINELEAIRAGGHSLPMTGKTALLDDLITVGTTPAETALMWIDTN